MDKLKTLRKLEDLRNIVDQQKGFNSKAEFLEWAARIEPLLAFNRSYQSRFAADLSMIHANLSSQTATPLADRMRTTLFQAIEQLKHEIDTADEPQPIKASNSAKEYIHPDRMKELRQVSSDKFDLCKLVRLCEELNECYRTSSILAIILLTRALIDHVPPLLGFTSFNEVANNYAGIKSFKERIDRLNTSSRKIADQHLHTPIRKSESIPTMNQADFSNDIDVLLAEIYRILKKP